MKELIDISELQGSYLTIEKKKENKKVKKSVNIVKTQKLKGGEDGVQISWKFRT